MSDELTKILEELRQITNKFNLTGSGVGGNLKEGFTVETQSGGGSILPPEE